MRRYELMLVIRPDVADDKSQALVDRTTRQIVTAGGQIVKVAPWGRRRLAYPIDRHREGSYQIILFEAPPEAIVELEHTLLITEEVLRHLVTRVERPTKASRRGRRGGRRARRRGPAFRTRRGRRGGSRRDHRRIRERGGPGRHRLREDQPDGVLQGHDHRQSRARPGDALHADRQAGDPVHRRGQPEHQEPADRRMDRGDGLVPGQRLRRSRRAGGRAAAQGQPRLRRRPLPHPRVRGQRRPEADLARHHRRQRHQPREAPARRRRCVQRRTGRRIDAGPRFGRPIGGGGGRPPADDTDIDDLPF